MIKLTKKETTALKGFTFIDLFAGIGAFHSAFSSFGTQCVFACEWDVKVADIYSKNYNMTPYGDITKIDEADIPDCDIVCAGFPCQPFSISGKQKGFEDTRGTLFFDVARIVEAKQPKVVILENVKNFASHDGGKTISVVLQTLNDIGYNVFYKVLNAADYGVPQKRERIFFVCFRKDLNIKKFAFPEPIRLKTHLCDLLLNNEDTKGKYIYRDDIIMNDKKEVYTNKPLRLGIVNKGGQGERIYSTKGVAITLSAYGGGVGAKTGLYLMNDGIRRLVPRECARLDGFSDNFIIAENDNEAYKQFGNSIVVDVIQYIVREIIKVI